MAAKPYSKLKGDPYEAYEALPAEVRRALQEALVDWCPLRVREWHVHLRQQEGLRRAQVADFLVQAIRRKDHAEIADFAKTWSAGAQAYPHLAAGATIQSYTGTDGIPAAEPVRLIPTRKPVRPVSTHKPVRVAPRKTPSKVRAKKRPAGRRSRR